MIFKIILVIVYLFFGFVCASIYDSWGFDDSAEPPMILILFVVMLNFAYLLGKRIAKWLDKIMEDKENE